MLLGQKAHLRVVGVGNLHREVPNGPRPGFLQPFERDMRYQLVRDIARLHGLHWLVRRETQHVDGTIERLDDDDLIRLHGTLRKAQECILDGIGFDDAGLM
jgi:hypothetical protein